MAEFNEWVKGRPVLGLRKSGTFDSWAAGWPILQFLPDILFQPTPLTFVAASANPGVILGSITITPTAVYVVGQAIIGPVSTKSLDVTIVWRYAKRGNVEEFDLVRGTEDPAKAPAFSDYEVQVYTKRTVGDAFVYRRTAFVTTEEYTYTRAMNEADAGEYYRFLRFVILVRETTSFRSVSREKEVVVV